MLQALDVQSDFAWLHSFAEVPRGNNQFNSFEIQIVHRVDRLYLFKLKFNIFYSWTALDITLSTVPLNNV